MALLPLCLRWIRAPCLYVFPVRQAVWQCPSPHPGEAVNIAADMELNAFAGVSKPDFGEALRTQAKVFVENNISS